MKLSLSVLLPLLLLLAPALAHAQGWKLTRNRDGIKVYQSEGSSGFRNIKVECELAGSFEGFTKVLGNVAGFRNWVYGNKQAYILKRTDANDYYYYSETAIPWPLQNRDAVVRARIERDPQGRWLKLTESGVSGLVPPQEGKVRVTKSNITWTLTQKAPGLLGIVYVFEAEPGGSIPAWIANAFADKGPYESFKKLSVLLKAPQ
ncbi:MAG: hypothetical protein EOO16_18240 [Chitinophagaceae bacterium]|nr:MAG: hypothetical protein EOO16_18240 [Chitinophagaceae bacterium]